MRIRKVQSADLGEWLRMREALWPRNSAEDLRREVEEILRSPDGCETFVAEASSGGLCGFAEVSLRDGSAGCLTKPVGYVEAWWVDTEWRRQGIGRELVAAAEGWARGKGCQEMASDTTPDYPGSPEAHQALGYEEVEEPMHFRKALTQ